MTAIGWLLLCIGIGVAIDLWHGQNPYTSLEATIKKGSATSAGAA